MAWIAALDRKLLRELKSLKGQIATIALVLASGITCFIALRGTSLSLQASRDDYYERSRFADVFARLERAPEPLAARIEALPGVARVQTRIVEEVTLPLPDLERAADGQLLSLPAQGEPATNALHLTTGRFRHGDGWAVYRIDGGRAALAAVQIGHRGETDVEVLAGLAPGVAVAVHPGDRVQAGARVEAR